MTELETIKRAKMYMDKLANGINPIDNTGAAENDIINNVRLSKCFLYISGILQQIIENDGKIKKTNNTQKMPFFLTNEQRSMFIPINKPITVSEMTNNLNEIANLEKCKKLSYSFITDWLINIGALEVYTDLNGKAKKRPTQQGMELGISVEIRNGMHGEYRVVVYNKSAQQFLVDNIDAIVSFKKENTDCNTENRGQPWTQSEEESLIELFNKNIPVSEIALTLKRTKTGIRDRLKKLGLMEK